MTDLHKAIRAIHNNAVTINGDTKEDIVAVDNSGNTITIDWTQVEAWTDPDAYKINRLAEYPSLQEFAEAYTEKEIGGDSTKWDAYKTAYNKVRSDNPKG
tara:strand:- start:533 stop:832 length:300 start_codon:yes stop_codon:yes gene_type:complete